MIQKKWVMSSALGWGTGWLGERVGRILFSLYSFVSFEFFTFFKKF